MADKSPKNVTVSGRLSFPVWTAKAAYDRSQKGKYPAADVADAAPEFNLLLEPRILDKFRTHVTDVFFPYCLEQNKVDAKRDNLDAKEIKALTDQIFADDFDGPYNVPLRKIHDKTAPLAPECVANLKVIGNKGVDMQQLAIVNEDDLLVPDPDQLTWPTTRPIGLTKFSMYPGAIVAVTLNLYAYHNGKLPGFSAGGSVAVFKADADRFGGGLAVDEDDIFDD